uniref:Uncharacterized protein n=1 Tax=Romanomermis culicivorax TaxID=13658 RepID=A0A915IQE1_ROMCU
MQTVRLNPKLTQFRADGNIILLRTGGLSSKAQVKMGVTCQPLRHSPWYLLCLPLWEIDISHLERRAQDPGAPLADAKQRKTLTEILQK